MIKKKIQFFERYENKNHIYIIRKYEIRNIKLFKKNSINKYINSVKINSFRIEEVYSIYLFHQEIC